MQLKRKSTYNATKLSNYDYTNHRSTINSAVADKPHDTFVQMQWHG